MVPGWSILYIILQFELTINYFALGGGTCSQEPDRGSCAKLITRWFYSTKVASCLTFQYGGCDGNTNNFATEEECEKFCSLHQDGINYLLMKLIHHAFRAGP